MRCDEEKEFRYGAEPSGEETNHRRSRHPSCFFEMLVSLTSADVNFSPNESSIFKSIFSCACRERERERGEHSINML